MIANDLPCGDAERATRQMAHRSSRHRIRPIAALALEADATIGPRCANIHLGQEDHYLHRQAGYTTAPDSMVSLLATDRLTSGRSPYTGFHEKAGRCQDKVWRSFGSSVSVTKPGAVSQTRASVGPSDHTTWLPFA